MLCGLVKYCATECRVPEKSILQGVQKVIQCWNLLYNPYMYVREE